MKMDNEEQLFLYDTMTGQKVLVYRQELIDNWGEYKGWKVWESTTGNPKVEDWIKKNAPEAKDSMRLV